MSTVTVPRNENPVTLKNNSESARSKTGHNFCSLFEFSKHQYLEMY